MINRLTARPAALLARVGSKRRGLSMLEYALMALVVIAVFGLMVTFLPNIFGQITSNFSDSFGSNNSRLSGS